MKIHSLQLTSFGKFKNKTISFSDGINFIYGKNEAGKSTIMAFIKAMLYGFTGRGSDGDRNKYKPWDGETLSGEMEVTLSDGRRVIIHRTSGRTPAKDECHILDAVTGEPCSVDLVAEIGIGENAFLKTVFLRQMDTSFVGSDEELTDKLINLAGSGDADVGFEDAIHYLRDKIRFYKHQRGEGGHLGELKKEISRLQSEIEVAESENKKLLGYIAKEKELQKEIDDLKDRLQILSLQRNGVKAGESREKALNAQKRLTAMQEGRERAKTLLQTLLTEAKSLSVFDKPISDSVFLSLENPKPLEKQFAYARRNTYFFRILTVIFIVLGVTLSIFVHPYGFIGILIAVIFGYLSIKQGKTQKDIVKSLESIQESIKLRNTQLEAFGCSTLKEYTEKLAKKQALDERIRSVQEKISLLSKEVSEATDLYTVCRQNAEIYNGVAGFNGNIDEIECEIIKTEQLLSEKTRETATIEGIRVGRQDIETDLLLTEQACLKEKLAEEEKELAALQLAADTLEDVYAMLSRDFTPKISEKASAYFSSLTGRENEKLLLDRSFSVTVGREEHRPLKAFSGGTIDQAFLAVRLAIAEHVLQDPEMPVFLDDAFLQYDATREENAVSLLHRLAETKQIFWFSCQDRDTNKMNRIEI